MGEIRVYMGHASLSTTEIYMHFAPKHDAAQRLTAAFGELAQSWWVPSVSDDARSCCCQNSRTWC